MTTAEQIVQMITARPRTKEFLASKIGVSEKTIRNNLGAIHYDHESGKSRFAVFRTGIRAAAYYGIVNSPIPKRMTVNSRKFSLDAEFGTLEGGVYNTVVYSRSM